MVLGHGATLPCLRGFVAESLLKSRLEILLNLLQGGGSLPSNSPLVFTVAIDLGCSTIADCWASHPHFAFSRRFSPARAIAQFGNAARTIRAAIFAVPRPSRLVSCWP